MRRILATMHVTLDGKTVRPDGRIDWIGHSPDTYDLDAFARCDACVLGRKMYPEYAYYWHHAADAGDSTPEAKRYAEYANSTPHYVLSRSVKRFDWPMARPVCTLNEIAALREQPGGDICIIGGATTVGAFIDADLLDELRLSIHPTIIAQGTSLFDKILTQRNYALAGHHPLTNGSIRLIYRTVRTDAESLAQRFTADLLRAAHNPHPILTAAASPAPTH